MCANAHITGTESNMGMRSNIGILFDPTCLKYLTHNTQIGEKEEEEEDQGET
jgi:hypothetical protein